MIAARSELTSIPPAGDSIVYNDVCLVGTLAGAAELVGAGPSPGFGAWISDPTWEPGTYIISGTAQVT